TNAVSKRALCATRTASPANPLKRRSAAAILGALASSASGKPVNAPIGRGSGTPGRTSVWKVSASASRSIRTAPISQIRADTIAGIDRQLHVLDATRTYVRVRPGCPLLVARPQAIDDAAAVEVVRRELDPDAVAGIHADAETAHLAGGIAEGLVPVVETDPE